MSSAAADYYSTLPLNVSPNVTTSSSLNDQPIIGLIGMGAMGKMYAHQLSDAGWRKCVDCGCTEEISE
jgi:prephenate dehydrogenase (NADP+)